MNEPSILREAHEKVKTSTIVSLVIEYIDYMIENKKFTSKDDIEKNVYPMISKMMDTGMCTFNVINTIKTYVENSTMDLLKIKREGMRFELYRNILHEIMDGRDYNIDKDNEEMISECKELRDKYRVLKNTLMTRYKGVVDETISSVLDKFEKVLDSEFRNLVKP